MSLRINLPKRKYFPNDPVTGTVTLVGTEDVAVTSISITFSGHSETKVAPSHNSTYKSYVTLFTYSKVLFTGPHTLHPNGHSWPFAFRFPARCKDVSGDIFYESSDFNDFRHQEIPPSYHLCERGAWTKKSAYVSYQLEATLVRQESKLFTSQCASTSRQLQLITPRKTAEPNQEFYHLRKPLTHQTFKMLPQNRQRTLTLREKLREKFSPRTPETVPGTKLELILRLPTIGVLGQVLPIHLSVKHNLWGASRPPPTVYLRSVSVVLVAAGSLRCLKTDAHTCKNIRNRVVVKTWADDIKIASKYLHATKTPIPERTANALDLRELMNLKLRISSGRSALARWALAPTFETFNIKTRYRLRVKIAFECAQKSFRAEFLSKELELVAGEWIGQYEDSAVAPDPERADAPVDTKASGLELLPPYARDPELWNPTAVKYRLC